MQGDCLSAILFILYFARRAIKPIKANMEHFLITTKYADGKSYAGISKQQVSELEKKVPEFLNKFELTVNTNKTERLGIPKSPSSPPKTSTMKTLISH